MQAHDPFFIEAGAGPGVVCIHSNASTSSQWRPLLSVLSDRFHVLAADSLGAGKGPAWPADRPVALADEVALLEPVLARAGDPFVLVGHSYGAAVALVAALQQPSRIRALALYEPTLFGLLDAAAPGGDAATGIREAVGEAAAAVAQGDLSAAARRFIDYWMGAGSYAAMPPARQAAIAASVANVAGWGHALFHAQVSPTALAALDLPVLLMTGGRSPVSGQAVAKLLSELMPRVQLIEFTALGHMGPVTDPATVNACIAAFLDGL